MNVLYHVQWYYFPRPATCWYSFKVVRPCYLQSAVFMLIVLTKCIVQKSFHSFQGIDPYFNTIASNMIGADLQFYKNCTQPSSYTSTPSLFLRLIFSFFLTIFLSYTACFILSWLSRSSFNLLFLGHVLSATPLSGRGLTELADRIFRISTKNSYKNDYLPTFPLKCL